VCAFSPFLPPQRKSDVALRAVADSHRRRQFIVLSSIITTLIGVGPSGAIQTNSDFLCGLLHFCNNNTKEEPPPIRQQMKNNSLKNNTLFPTRINNDMNASSSIEAVTVVNNISISTSLDNKDDTNTSTIVTITMATTDDNITAIICENENKINCTVIE
jgi:hypothetical protein